MAKFVHVDAERVRSGMQRLGEARADDSESEAAEQRFEAHADEFRAQRDREYAALEAARTGSDVVDPDHRSARAETD